MTPTEQLSQITDLISGAIQRHAADAVVLATGGYGNVFNLSTYARGSNATASSSGHP